MTVDGYTAVGPMIDGLGIITGDLIDDELIETALVLLKVNGPTGSHLRLAWPEGQSWMERVGMLAVAHNEELNDTGDER